jgi:UDP-GlcNAc:undecaprenyl-phosphate GlcNAc-1-phosphate transferase
MTLRPDFTYSLGNLTVNLAFAFAVGLFAVYLIVPRLMRFALEKGILDRPGGHKIHKRETPTLGGFAIFFGFLLAMLVVFPFCRKFFINPASIYNLFGILIGAGIIFLMGLFDDIFGLPPILKLIAQVFVGVAMSLFDIRIDFLTLPFREGYIFLVPWQAWLVTIFWVVAIMNAVNFIDGVDGLACGISGIAAATFLVIALIGGQREFNAVSALLAAGLLGCCAGFLPFNFHPAKIFLGDSGSQLLGFLLAAIAITGTFKTPAALTLFVPILILGIPIFDTSWAVLRRSWQGKALFRADNSHVHHELLKRGLGPQATVLALYGVAIVLGVLAVLLSK